VTIIASKTNFLDALNTFILVLLQNFIKLI